MFAAPLEELNVAARRSDPPADMQHVHAQKLWRLQQQGRLALRCRHSLFAAGAGKIDDTSLYALLHLLKPQKALKAWQP